MVVLAAMVALFLFKFSVYQGLYRTYKNCKVPAEKRHAALAAKHSNLFNKDN